MDRVRRRIARSGFFLFFFGFLLLALGLAQGIDILIYVGLAILVAILGTIITRSFLDIRRPRRRAATPATTTTRTTTTRTTTRRGPATHDPDNY